MSVKQQSSKTQGRHRPKGCLTHIHSFCCNKTSGSREESELGEPPEAPVKCAFIATISDNMSKGCRGSVSRGKAS